MIRRLLASRRFMREHRWTHAHPSEYVDAELSEREAARVEEHVSLCPQCHRVLATLRRMLAGLGSLRVEPDPGVAEQVIEHLRRGEH